MEINYTEMHGYENKAKSDLGFDFFEQIVIEGDGANSIMKRLSQEYEIYQYDDNVKYKEHDIFSWDNGSNRYYQLTVNDEKLNEEEIKSLESSVIEILENGCKNFDVIIWMRKGYSVRPEKVEDFLFSYTLDLGNLNLEKFSVIQDLEYASAIKISNEARKRYSEIDEQFLQLMEGKKAIINNNLEGSFKKISDGIVFFKKRARKNYYKISLNKLHNIELIQ